MDSEVEGSRVSVAFFVVDGASWRILRAVSGVDDGLAVVAAELSRLSFEVVAMTRADIGLGLQHSRASVDELLVDVEVTVRARAVSLGRIHSLTCERDHARSEAKDSVFGVEDSLLAWADGLPCVWHGVLDRDRTAQRREAAVLGGQPAGFGRRNQGGDGPIRNGKRPEPHAAGRLLGWGNAPAVSPILAPPGTGFTR